jgi:hypothetical protein
MTVRSRRETQEGVGVASPERRRALLGTPPQGAAVGSPGAATQGESWELITEVTPRPVPVEQATPTELTARPERSEPLRMISMKAQAEAGAARPVAEPRVPLHVQLRTMAEVAGVHEPAGLGRLAPPRDPRQARTRHRRANLAWACIAVVLAGGIALSIWLIAGR